MSNASYTRCAMVALGGCPTAEPPAELRQEWRETVMGIMRGVDGANEYAEVLRKSEIDEWLDNNPALRGEVDDIRAELSHAHA